MSGFESSFEQEPGGGEHPGEDFEHLAQRRLRELVADNRLLRSAKVRQPDLRQRPGERRGCADSGRSLDFDGTALKSAFYRARDSGITQEAVIRVR